MRQVPTGIDVPAEQQACRVSENDFTFGSRDCALRKVTVETILTTAIVAVNGRCAELVDHCEIAKCSARREMLNLYKDKPGGSSELGGLVLIRVTRE
jgi:hypothetical protein